MASGTRGTNTMTEQLRALLGQIADMKAAPDADIAYLTNLETTVLRYLRAPFEKQRLEAQLGGPGGGLGQAQAGATAPTPAGPAAQLLFGAQPAQPRPTGANMPAADELRRLMEQPAL